MTTAVAPQQLRFTPPQRFENAAEWLHALGDVPLQRIIFDPWPGTATEEDLLRYVEAGDKLCELIDGTLVEKPVGLIEAFIAMNLSLALGNYVRKNGLGMTSGAESTLRMRSGKVRLPDLCFFSKGRLPEKLSRVPLLSPDLAVEVLSPDNTKAEMNQKLREYFQSGTRLVWFVDPPKRTVAVYRSPEQPIRILNETDSLDGEEVVPGFAMPVAELFANLPASEE